MIHKSELSHDDKTNKSKMTVIIFFDKIINSTIKKTNINYFQTIIKKNKENELLNCIIGEDKIKILKHSKYITRNNKINFHDFMIAYYNIIKSNRIQIVWDNAFNAFYNHTQDIIINKKYIQYRTKGYELMIKSFYNENYKCVKFFYNYHKCVWDVEDFIKLTNILPKNILEWCETTYSIYNKLHSESEYRLKIIENIQSRIF